jgi:glycosyltransferase involved in cell wall biosynthesis
MKIVILTADYPPDVWSGIGVAVHRQVLDLTALGVEVQVVIVRSRDAAIPPIDGADWIHLHSLPLTELALALRLRLKAGLAYTVHTQPWLELGDHGRRRFWLDLQTRLLSACDRTIFLSDAEHRTAQTLFPELSHAVVIPHGVPRPPTALPGRDSRDVVLFAGRFAVSKGVLLLEQCIRHAKRRTDLRFVIAGGHGDDEGEAAVRRLAGDCEVVGWLSREDLDALLGRSRLVVVPSRYEPFGLIALEAMRMGAPVLAANVGGLRELARPGSGGMRLDSADPDEWAGEMLRITRDEVLWTALHRQGPAFVDAHYRPAHAAARLLDEVYQSRGVGAVMTMESKQNPPFSARSST